MAKRSSRNIFWVVVAFAAVTGVALLVYAKPAALHLDEGASSKAKLEYRASEAAPSAEAESVPVATAPVQSVERPATLPVTGTLVADEDSDVASNASGTVMEVLVDRGSLVKKGDVLVRLDPEDAENVLAEGTALAEELRVRLSIDKPGDPFQPENMPEYRLAVAELELAQSKFHRAEELYSKKVISTEQYDQARTQRDSTRFRAEMALQEARRLYQSYQTALTRLRALRKAVDDTTIVAPFDGWVAERKVAVGERLQTAGPNGSTVVTLVRLNPIRLSLTVPQQNIAQVRPGQPVTLQVDAFPGQTFTGEVRYIAPKLTDAGRSLVVEAVVPNSDLQLRPGLFATAQLQLERSATELYVPASAVQKEGEVGRVYVVRDGAAREQVVSVGSAEGDRVQILTGLKPEDVVVLNAAQVTDGAVVRR